MSKYKDEIKAGIIIMSGLTLIALFVILIGGDTFYDKYDVYYIKLMDVAGIDEGSSVRLGGLKVGRIQQMRAPDKPNESVTVVIGLNRGTQLFKGTKAKISQVGFVGEIYLDLSLENTIAGTIPPGSVLPSEERVQFSDLVVKLGTAADSLDKLIKDMDMFFGDKNRRHIEDLLTNTNKTVVEVSSKFTEFSQNLTQSSKELQSVLKNMDDILLTNKDGINEALRKFNEDLTAIGIMIKSMDKAAVSITQTSDSVKTVVSDQSENLAAMFDSIKITLDDLQDVLQEVKAKPWSLIHAPGKGKESE
ncbi:MAG: MlaD family protein [Nitrospirae bacterium YQR-1]